MKKQTRSHYVRKNKKGGNCGCGSGNSTLSKMINYGGKKRKTRRVRGGKVEFDAVGMPVNAISLNGQQNSPLYLVHSGRVNGGKKTRNHRKKGGMGFSDWTNSSNNPVIQFNTIPGANLSTSILSGTSYNNTPNNSMNLQFKPMV